jgi:DNA repair protein SbcD/Mre11
MKILHTADWHVGKKLGRIDRASEARAVFDELVSIATTQQPDVIVVAGDLFDRGLPAFDSLRSVLDILVRLASTGARLVAIPGNHDSADLFEVLAPHLAHAGITLVHKPLPADAGGIVEVESRDGKEVARIACFPFLHQAYVVDFMADEWDRHKSYADRVRAICRHYAEHLENHARKDAVDILMGHFMVHNAVPSGSERPLYIGEAYMATEDAIPHHFHYVALGHIHKAQPAPGSEDYARYSGSLLQLDFGEAEQDKGVVIAEVSPDGTRRIEQIPITGGRKLMKVKGTLDELRARAPELEGMVLSVEVVTDRPSPTLADEIHEFLPGALYVRVDNPQAADYEPRHDGLSLDELYAAFHLKEYGSDPAPDLAAAFHDLVEEVGVKL